MDTSELITLVENLISFPSTSGKEEEILGYIHNEFLSWGWPAEIIPVENNRYNIFVTFGTPTICYTTHIDVVPGPAHLFTPVFKDNTLYGRGACDAKGIAGAMIAAARILLEKGAGNFALLLVVGEETNGIGAKTAARDLQNKGIQYLINGEPTECKLMLAHRGGITLKIRTTGHSCHSGYPERGDDANKKLINIAHRLLNLELGEDVTMGKASMNIGKIVAGSASNTVSDSGELSIMIRTVSDNNEVLGKIESCLCGEGEMEILNSTLPIHLTNLPGFETSTAAYSTDIPNFLSLKTKNILFGPGTIHVAHTDNEHITCEDLEEGVRGYERMYWLLAEGKQT